MAAINSADLALKLNITHSRVKKSIRDAGIPYLTDGAGGYVIEEAAFSNVFGANAKAAKVYKHKKRKSTTSSKTTAQKKKRAAA